MRDQEHRSLSRPSIRALGRLDRPSQPARRLDRSPKHEAPPQQFIMDAV